jgi:glycosyltransferase involved in cell wall biosynthesis
MKLLIAIPALNEEDSIEAIIRRSLAAVPHICAVPGVDAVEVTVVSDGSTDRTVERARAFVDRIRLIVFEKNRGYGAAIQEAWRQSDAELLGFLDADGTCEPLFFADLCGALLRQDADVVLGCRLHGGSRMPLVRRVGNTVFALLLSLFSAKRVRDTASGMRVVRRASLAKLLPLPDGLHFTPAMSARALLADDVCIEELDMPYHERAGESKLRVGKDGLRFLRVIVNTALLYRPGRPLALLGLGCALAAALLMVQPAAHYAATGTLREWMIYRFIVAHLFGLGAAGLLCAAHFAARLVSIALAIPPPTGVLYRFSRDFLGSRLFWLVPLALAAAGTALVLPSVIERVVTGGTHGHWSRFVAMSAFLSVAGVLVLARLLDFILDLLATRLEYLRLREHA